MQTAYAMVYLEINLMSILLLVFIRFRTLGISRMVSQRNFSMAIDSQITLFITDTAAVLAMNGVIPNSRALIVTLKTLYFLSTALMCYYWFIYFEHLQGSRFVSNRRRVLLASAFVWVMGVLLNVNLFNGMLFYVDDAGTYRRGPLFAVQYLLSYIYVFGASGHAAVGLFQKEKRAHRSTLLSLVLFPVVPAIFGNLQFKYPELPLVCAALSLATLVMYQNWVDELISLDPLTHLNNRKQLVHQYQHHAAHRSQGEAALYLMLIDANKFKAINDTYGHIQGDAALTRIAEALKMACRGLKHRANICRYGGDEFAILIRADSVDELDALRRDIADNLKALNDQSGAPYPLTVSIGGAKAEGDISLKDLIVRADQQLYREKRG